MLAGRRPGLRGRGGEVLRALHADPDGHQRARACGTRPTASTTTSIRRASDGPRWPVRARSMTGLIPLYAVGGRRPGGRCARLPGVPRRACATSCKPARARAAAIRVDATGERPTMLGAGRARPAAAPARAPRRRGRVPVPARRARAVGRLPRPSVRDLGGRARRRPASTTSRPSRRPALFGGNSNWRGPVWFPVNYLLDRGARMRYHQHLGDDYRSSSRAGRGSSARCEEVASTWPSACRRSSCATSDGRRPVFGDLERFQSDPAWRDSCSSTSTSTATTAPGWAPRTRPAGPAWWPT